MQKTRHQNQPPYSTSPLLDQHDCILHGFFGAQGGVSEGNYTSLNCGYSSKDLAQSVGENRARVAACFELYAENLTSLRQAHTTTVIEITHDTPPQFDCVADGMVSCAPGVALGALGADCAPVLYVDPKAAVVGAAHSGWKGALDGINEQVINDMCRLGARVSNISAAVGPAMQQAHYEVKADFKARFEQDSPIDYRPFFAESNDKLYFDTPAYIKARLLAAGITKVEVSTQDTFSQADQYFSYRRSCQQGLDDYGRQIAVITLK